MCCMHHHVGGQHLDHLDHLCSCVLLAVLQTLVQIDRKRPKSVSVDGGNYVLVETLSNVGRLEQSPC